MHAVQPQSHRTLAEARRQHTRELNPGAQRFPGGAGASGGAAGAVTYEPLSGQAYGPRPPPNFASYVSAEIDGSDVRDLDDAALFEHETGSVEQMVAANKAAMKRNVDKQIVPEKGVDEDDASIFGDEVFEVDYDTWLEATERNERVAQEALADTTYWNISAEGLPRHVHPE